jgi:hypothetical protein
MNTHHQNNNNILIIVFSLLLGCSGSKTTESKNYPNTPDVSFYAGTGEDCCGEDPHPVHGIEATDGSFILCGKSIDAEGSTDGFLLKVDPTALSGMVFLEEEGDHQYSWSTTFGSAGVFDAANAVASSGNSILMVGAKSLNNKAQRVLHKYDLSSGDLIWEKIIKSPNSNKESAFESIYITPSGGAILAGFVGGEAGGIEGFKSYGNPVSGEANVMYFSPELIDAGIAPESPTWEKSYNLNSIRSIRPVQNDGYVFVAANEEINYVVVRIDSEGNEQWRTPLTDHGEATDISVLSDNSGFAITGHKGISEGIDGSVTKIDLDGNILWGKTYGNPEGGITEFAGLDAGNPTLIFDECWGIQPTEEGGAIIACGTGIEGCDEYESGSDIQEECTSDPRTKWRAMLIEINGDGEELWYRTDSYYFADEPQEGAASASEYVIKTSDGNYVSVIDQDFGIGIMMLEYSD